MEALQTQQAAINSLNSFVHMHGRSAHALKAEHNIHFNHAPPPALYCLKSCPNKAVLSRKTLSECVAHRQTRAPVGSRAKLNSTMFDNGLGALYIRHFINYRAGE